MTTSSLSPFSSDGSRLIWRFREQTLWVEPWGQGNVRVRATTQSAMPSPEWVLLPAAAAPAARVELGAREATLFHGDLRITVDLKGRVRCFKTDSEEALVEEVNFRTNYPPSRTFRSVGGDLSRATAAFTAWEDERIYGLGQRRHGLLDQKGCVLELTHRNSEISIPFLVSSRGYGVVWHNPAMGRVELGRTQTRWVADATRLIDYVIVTGEDYGEIMGRYADLTGHAPMMPEWAAGFWQCKLRYQTQEELLEVAREHKRRGLPMDIIVVDYFAWSRMGDWRFDPTCWPDPRAMVEELKELGIRVMVSVWPTVNPDSENFTELEQRNLLVRTERGHNSFVKFTDANANHTVISGLLDTTHPDARAFLWEKVKQNYYDTGIKVWWLDAIEPEMAVYDHDNMRYFAGVGSEVGCIYPLGQQQAFYEGMKAAGETEIVSLGRAGFLGSQRFGAAIWSGDIHSTWDDLRQQVRAGLNIGLSGIPWWTTDIGGFFGGEVENPAFRELLVRWFQYGTFCPLFRLHGWRNSSLANPESSDPTRGGPNEVWSYGEEAYAILRQYLFLRERLKPYILEQMQVAAEKGIPPMRPLFFDFSDDATAATVEDQFLFGADLVVAPILEPGATSRSVYLPAVPRWKHAWTGEWYDGGQRIEVDAPLAQIPLFLREGRELPIVDSVS
jgi:alpha-D-xyloside xylohydrolase